MVRVTGIGGVFFKSRHDSAALAAWYQKSPCGTSRNSAFMINYRVDNLGELIAKLRVDGVEIISGPESHENGKFAWIMDPSGAVGADALG